MHNNYVCNAAMQQLHGRTDAHGKWIGSVLQFFGDGFVKSVNILPDYFW